MNVLFVFSLQESLLTTKPLEKQEQIQFGISYISSFLKKYKHNTKLVVLTRQNHNLIYEHIDTFCPTLICFTAASTEYSFMASIARYVKRDRPDIFLLAGGPHVSLNPQSAIHDAFDALCIGEGEEPVLELVEHLERGIQPLGIRNLWVKHGSEIKKNPTRPFLEDLDRLPFPDRGMWQEWIAVPASRYSVLLGRGCPFQCTYCCNHAFKKLAAGKYVRFRSPDNIVEEIRELTDTTFPEVGEIYLEVESLGINPNWAIELCSKLEEFNSKRIQPISFGANLRVTPNANFERLFAALKKSHFKSINIGVESGSERVRYEILKRNYSNQDIINTVRIARDYGLKVSFFNLIGIPGETVTDFQETVKINKICLPDGHLTSIFYPYPGTDLYTLCKKQGLLNGLLDKGIERRKAVLDLPGFSKKQIQKSYSWFDYYVYKGYKPIYKLLALVLIYKMYSKYRLARFMRLSYYYMRQLKRSISNF